MSLIRNGILAALGQYTVAIVVLGLARAVPTILAQVAGLWFKGPLPAQTLYRGVPAVLSLAGVNLLVRAALETLARRG